MKIACLRTLLALVLTATLLANANAGGTDDRGPDGLPKFWHADLSGVWSTGTAYTWLYEDHTMKTLDTNCGLVGTGTWKFEFGALKIYEGSKEVFFSQILDVPEKPNPGEKLVLDTTAEWMFMGRDTDQEC